MSRFLAMVSIMCLLALSATVATASAAGAAMGPGGLPFAATSPSMSCSQMCYF